MEYPGAGYPLPKEVFDSPSVHDLEKLRSNAHTLGYKPGDELHWAVGRLLPNGIWSACTRENFVPPLSFFVLIIVSAVAFTILRAILARHVLKALAIILHVKEANWNKFNESCMQMGFYYFAFVYNTKFLISQDFFYVPIVSFMDGFACQVANPEIFWFYGIEIGWYLHCVYAQFFIDSKKSDFWVMLAHHVITLSLQFLAFSFGYFRIGMLVMFSMDVCDVFLHGARMMRFVTAGGKVEFGLPAYIFGYLLIPLSWFGLRIVYFPIFVLYTTAVLTPFYAGWENAVGYIPFNTLLFLLFGLQIWWFGLICMIGLKASRSGDMKRLEDTREKAKLAGGNKKQS